MTSAISEMTPGRRERRRREVHERIIEAAVAQFSLKGFATTTAREIADAADVAEKTFYNHFPTKQSLIQEIARRATEDTAMRLDAARRFPGSTAERLRHFFESSAEGAVGTSRDFAREVMVELMRISAVDGTRHLHASLAAILAEGRARGDVAPDRDLEFLTEMTIATYLGIIVNWVTLPEYPIQKRLSALASLVGEAIAGQVAPQSGKALR